MSARNVLVIKYFAYNIKYFCFLQQQLSKEIL